MCSIDIKLLAIFLLCFQKREMSRVLYVSIVCFCLYLYVMVHVTESHMRVSHLGMICVFFTVLMQASPLASVVSGPCRL